MGFFYYFTSFNISHKIDYIKDYFIIMYFDLISSDFYKNNKSIITRYFDDIKLQFSTGYITALNESCFYVPVKGNNIVYKIPILFTNENNYSSFRLEKNGAKEIISRGYKIYNNYLDVDNLELIKNKFDYLIDLKHNVKANNGFSYSNQNDLRNKSSDIILTQPLLDIPQISKLITDNFFLEIACDFFKTEPFIAGLNVRKTFVNNLDSDGVQLYHCDRNHHKLLKIFI